MHVHIPSLMSDIDISTLICTYEKFQHYTENMRGANRKTDREIGRASCRERV